jgi:integrase
MKGWVITRTARDGSKRYDAKWRIAPGTIKGKTFDKRKHADRFLTTMVKRVQDGTYIDLQPALMGEVFGRWLEHSLGVRLKEGSLKPSTAKSYRSMVDEHLRPAFEAYHSDRLTLAVVEAWRADIAKKIAAGTMAPKFYVNVRNLLHSIIEWARHPERRYLAHDPLAGLPRIRLPRGKKRPHYEPGQVARLLTAASATPPDDTILHVALYSGLRRGELFALRWDDVEPGNGQDGGRLHVRRSIYQGTITAPKTEDSDRVVDVPQRLLDDPRSLQAHASADRRGLRLPAAVRSTDGPGRLASRAPDPVAPPGGPLPARGGPPCAPAHLRQPARRSRRRRALHRRPGRAQHDPAHPGRLRARVLEGADPRHAAAQHRAAM